MVRNQTLYSLSDLQDSGFGRPYPRHGLSLLYWFVTQCLQFGTNQITVLCSPSRGDYGFRFFHNNEKILPVTNLRYYEVGNLHHDEAKDLPEYVRRRYTGNLDDSNTDRIIICITRFSLDSVYVTKHQGQWTFNPNQTYCIHPELLKTIRDLEREDFLRQATSRHITIPESTSETSSSMHYYQPSPISISAWEYFRMCSSVIFSLFILIMFVFIIYSYFSK